MILYVYVYLSFYVLQKEETPEEAMARMKAKGKKELAVVDHNKIEYLDFNKDFYREVPEITKMTDEEVEAYREEMESIKIKGKIIDLTSSTCRQSVCLFVTEGHNSASRRAPH